MQIRIHTHTHTLSLSLFLTHSGTCAHTTVDSLVHTRSHVRIPTPSRSEVRGYGIEAGWWHVCGTALVPARARGGAAGRRTTAFWAAGLHMASHAVVTMRARQQGMRAAQAVRGVNGCAEAEAEAEWEAGGSTKASRGSMGTPSGACAGAGVQGYRGSDAGVRGCARALAAVLTGL